MAGCWRLTRFTWGSPKPREGQPAFEITSRNGQPQLVDDGWVSPYRRGPGTYLHGLFDNDGWRRSSLQELRQTRPGVHTTAPATSYETYEEFQEAQLDRRRTFYGVIWTWLRSRR